LHTLQRAYIHVHRRKRSLIKRVDDSGKPILTRAAISRNDLVRLAWSKLSARGADKLRSDRGMIPRSADFQIFIRRRPPSRAFLPSLAPPPPPPPLPFPLDFFALFGPAANFLIRSSDLLLFHFLPNRGSSAGESEIPTSDNGNKWTLYSAGLHDTLDRQRNNSRP